MRFGAILCEFGGVTSQSTTQFYNTGCLRHQQIMKAKTNGHATGCVAANLHEGSRSEQLADFVFSQWGTVTPVRGKDDHGTDLYCTLTERLGQRMRVRDYFVVQVKSEGETWKFNDRESVKWLIEHPVPIFLCVVNKKRGQVRVYHVMQRFYYWAMGNLPDSLELRPGEAEQGGFDGSIENVSAPILNLQWSDLIDEEKMLALRDLFAYWVRMDRENCDLVRQGLLRFRMPHSYRANNLSIDGISEAGLAYPEPELLKRGIRCLAEGIECIGGQLGFRGDRLIALEAALLLDRLQRTHPEAFENDLRFPHRVPGMLGTIVNHGLNRALNSTGYLYAGLEAAEKVLAEDPIIQKYLNEQRIDPDLNLLASETF
jgi:hypothetical protein